MEEANNYIRIKEVVKAKMQLQDYTGARSLIREALETSPQFDQATEMLTVCDILCSAGIQLPGIGVNWYWVLQLYASAEASIIDDQYRELVSLLDPIKNDFPGTGLALKFIEDAYSVLSDPVKRAIYDSKRNCTENASGDSNKAQDNDVVNASNAATADVAVGAIDLGASSSKSKRIIDEACNGSGSARRSTEDLDSNGKRKLCAQESCVETAPRISDCSDEGSFTHMPNPSTNMMDTCGSTGGNQIGLSKWSPKNFVADQVWAVYDGPDSMPRLYAKVINVFSQSEVCVTFLELNPMIDEEIQWVEEGLPVVCGIFRAGGGTTILEMSRFSHIVNCDTSSRKSFYRIFPQKGEVWAMYKNWNFKWKQTDHIPYECRLVEILSDYSEENGLIICSLVEVNGRLTFFQRQLYEGYQLTRQLSRLEMLSFSHRIPAFSVRGVKDSDIPKGSLHLEPDALPPKVFD